MATAICPDCGEALDGVPATQACPGCGGPRRHQRLEVPTLSVRLSLGEVGILVQNALGELVDLPARQAREVVEHVLQLRSQHRGRAVVAGDPTVDAAATRAPSLLRLVSDPVYGAMVLEWAGTVLAGAPPEAWLAGLRELLGRITPPGRPGGGGGPG